MKTVKTWLNQTIKNCFHTRMKSLVCDAVVAAYGRRLNPRLIGVLVSGFNWISRKTKFQYVEPVEICKHAVGTVVWHAETRLYAARPQFYYEDFRLTEVKRHDLFCIQVTDASVYGSSNLIMIGPGKVIYEQFFHEEEDRWDYTDTIIQRHLGPRLLLQHRHVTTPIPCGILLSGNFSWNYYHFIYEFLSKFLLIDKLNLPQDVPLIVDEVVRDVPQYNELLSYFNTSNRELVYVTPGNSYYVGTLYYPSFVNAIAPNFRDIHDIRFTDCLFSTESIDFLRDTLLPNMVTTDCRKRIFLSRRSASPRRGYNEQDVIRIFEKYGFQVVCPEQYSIAEQMFLFNSAAIIAGTTGAAFANILYCSPGCKVLCITQVQNELSVFSTIAKHLGLNLQYVPALEREHRVESLHDNFVIDPAKVEQVLIDFLEK